MEVCARLVNIFVGSISHTNAEIECLERIFAAPDTRSLSGAISPLPIEGTTKPSRIARGFGCGSCGYRKLRPS